MPVERRTRGIPTAKSETRGHGREETRVGIVVKAPDIAEHHGFPGLKAFGRIEARRMVDGKVESDVRIFALSRAPCRRKCC